MVAVFHELDESALIDILTQPKNSLTKQYHALFKMENVDISFTLEALHAIAKKALKRKIGARGLRSILENILLDTMYELPSLEGVKQVVVDENVILNEGKPVLVYADDEKRSEAIGE